MILDLKEIIGRNKMFRNNNFKELIRQYLFEVYAGSQPEEGYRDGHVDDMMLDKEGWITDPNDRKKVKQWYLDMGMTLKGKKQPC